MISFELFPQSNQSELCFVKFSSDQSLVAVASLDGNIYECHIKNLISKRPIDNTTPMYSIKGLPSNVEFIEIQGKEGKEGKLQNFDNIKDGWMVISRDGELKIFSETIEQVAENESKIIFGTHSIFLIT